MEKRKDHQSKTMLTINIRNVNDEPNDFADYTYTVHINDKMISSGQIFNHKRSDGWQELIEALLEDEVKKKREETNNQSSMEALS